MIYKKKVVIPATTKEVEVYVAPCIECNGDNIKIEEYEDDFGFISTARCRSCEAAIKENVSEDGIINAWNKKNDIRTLIMDKALQVEQLNREIVELRDKLQKKENGRLT